MAAGAGGGADDPIGISDLVFFASLAVGLTLLTLDQKKVRIQWPQLSAADHGLWIGRAGFGFLLGPMG